MNQPLTFLAAAEKTLADAGEPMHYRDITRTALDGGFLVTQGKTPEATLNAQIAVQLNERGDESTFVRVRPGVYGLRRWLDDGTLDPDSVMKVFGALIPHYPKNEEVHLVLPAWDGAPGGAISRMLSAMWEHTGTPTSPVDWTDPDSWIGERLEGESQDWARRTWEGSKKRVSPRYCDPHWHVIRIYQLLESNDGTLRLTDAGRDFLEHPEGETARWIDLDQGILLILRLVAEAGSTTPADLLEPWFEYLLEETKIRAESTAKGALSRRLHNLLDRDYVSRNGTTYSITEPGLRYLEADRPTTVQDEPTVDLDAEIRRLQQAKRDGVREGIRDILAEMDPFAFERLIQRLLDAMGYQDTEQTARSGDGGADVLGTIKVGISEIKEVVQVKRQKANVGRPILDGLRGSLYRFDAVQGTIITTSCFTRDARAVAFDRGAAPIALIDGDTLIDLLIKHDIGVEKRKIELWSLNPDAFVERED